MTTQQSARAIDCPLIRAGEMQGVEARGEGVY